jgi:spore maturation protein CgeB
MDRILIIGDTAPYAISNNFLRAGKQVFSEIKAFDIDQAIRKYVRFGSIGTKINLFLPVEAWQRKGNRELAVLIKSYQPDLVLVMGNASVHYSLYAFIKSILKTKILLFWPDTLTNLTNDIQRAMPLYDGILTYSSQSISIFKQLGCKKVVWFPFAGDTSFLGGAAFNVKHKYDISFLGGWRPEREAALVAIHTAYPNLRFWISGPGWKKNLQYRPLKAIVSDQIFVGEEFGKILQQSKINLNVIDDTNYPAANMRFFEVPAVGGLQLCSSCPEQETQFLHRKHVIYFKEHNDLKDEINFILNNNAAAEQIRQNAFEEIQNNHTYKKRLETIKKIIDD